MAGHRQPPRHLFKAFQDPQSLRGRQRIERQLTRTVHGSVQRVGDLDDLLTAA
jgi:hypothetical protein